MDVVLEVPGRAQLLAREPRRAELDGTAGGVVVIEALERRRLHLCRVRRVIEAVERVVVDIVEHPATHVAGRTEARMGQEVHAVLVPGGPLPVAHLHRWVGTGVWRIPLLAALTNIADHIFVACPRRPSELRVELAVALVGAETTAASRLVCGTGEVGRERERVAGEVGRAALEVPRIQSASDIDKCASG